MRRALSALLLVASLSAGACSAGGAPAIARKQPAPAWPPAVSWAAPITYGDGGPAPQYAPEGPPPAALHPAGSLYGAATHGFDASYPQCADPRPPQGSEFGVVGVNGGKVFSLNPCFLELYRLAPGKPAIYLNSGFTRDNARKLVPVCDASAAALGLSGDQRLAYGLGCSTAHLTLSVLEPVGASQPKMWWIDVERGNSWDEQDLMLNRLSLEGEIDRLAVTGRPVGVYSTFADWNRLTANMTYPAIAANWVAGDGAPESCATPGFSGSPVWLAQELALWPGSAAWDSDYAC